MTGKHPPPVGGRTLVDQLRDDLSLCERWVLRLTAKARVVPPEERKAEASDGTGANGLALLRLLDRVTDELDRLERRGVDLRAERGRFESILNQVRRRDKALVALAGTAMTAQRPPDARWWWYLNEQVASGRRRALKRLLGFALTGLIVLTVLYFLYDRFLAVSLPVRRVKTHFFQGEQAASAGNLAQAIDQFERVTTLEPEYAEAHLWLGVLYQKTGNADRATVAFRQARTLFDTEVEFYFGRGLIYLALNDNAAAAQDARIGMQLDPRRPEGYFLHGIAAEQVGDLQLARVSFQQAVASAEATGETELQVTARLRLAGILQQLIVVPEQ